MEEKIYYQTLARFDKIGPVRLRNLLKTFPGVEIGHVAIAIGIDPRGAAIICETSSAPPPFEYS